MVIRAEAIWRWVLIVVIVLAIVALIAFARGRTRPTVHMGVTVSALEQAS